MARRRSKSRSAASSTLPGWVWMLAGLAIGLAIAEFIYHRNTPALVEAPAGRAGPTAKAAPATAAQPAPQPAAPTRPADDATQYDFYDILPSFEVVIPERDPVPTRDRPSRTVTEPGRYLLQAGSFSTHGDADQRQASLALLGIEAEIQRVTIEEDVFYRVRIGPIEDLDELNRVRRRLSEAHIEALLMKAP